MELYIAGGVGEHGRNCFCVKDKDFSFLVDSGTMAGTPDDPYPRIAPEAIPNLSAVFLTHSHADHSGALPWLYENGFCGAVIASGETLRQLTFPVKNFIVLEQLCPEGANGDFRGLAVSWGRSGHCAGSVWYKFYINGKTILFSGDYTEDSRIYACDIIRDQKADIAVLDCAYGRSENCFEQLCDSLVFRTKKLLQDCSAVLFPVPKYGRGPELLNLFSERLGTANFYADELFIDNLSVQATGGFWFRPARTEVSVRPYTGCTPNGIVFVSSPQLNDKTARETADAVFASGGGAIMTGTADKGSYSDFLIRHKKMEQLRYPVHLSYTQYKQLASKNHFAKTVPYHSAEFSSPRKISF